MGRRTPARTSARAARPNRQGALEGLGAQVVEPEDIERLKQLLADGKDAREIALELHRELKQVQKKDREMKD